MQTRAKRIVFVNRFYYPDTSATSQILNDLCSYLSQQGRNVTVITSRQRYTDAAASLPKREFVQGTTVIRVATSRFGRDRLAGRIVDYASFYVGAGWALVRILGPDDVVVAMTDPPLISVVSAGAALLRRAVLVNWMQDVFPEVAGVLGLRKPWRALLAALKAPRNWSLARGRYNVVLSPQMKVYLSACSAAPESFRVIENWPDDNIRPVPRERDRLRQEWGLGHQFVVGYSGNLGRVHDSQTLLQAIRALASDADVAFLFIGSGARLETLRREVESEGLANVLFRPYQPRERLSESLGVPDLHLVTQLPKTEGLVVPSKLYGIAAAGRPILFVGCRSGYASQMIEAHRCGQVIAVGDGAGLAESIRRLSRDREAVARMGENARRAYETKFTAQQQLSKWRALLDECLRENAS